MFVLGAIVILGIIILLLNYGISAQSNAVEEKIEAAEHCVDEAKFEDAISIYQEVLLLVSSEDVVNRLTEAYIAWAEYFVEREDYLKAIEILESVDERADKNRIETKLDEIKWTVTIEVVDDNHFCIEYTIKTNAVYLGDIMRQVGDLTYKELPV